MGGKTSKSRRSSESRPAPVQKEQQEASARQLLDEHIGHCLPETPASPRPNIWGELLTANGVYPGSAQFPDTKIEQLITAGMPFACFVDIHRRHACSHLSLPAQASLLLDGAQSTRTTPPKDLKWKSVHSVSMRTVVL